MVLNFAGPTDIFKKSPEDNQVDKYEGNRQVPTDPSDVSGNILSPIGSIVAWAKSLTNTPALPVGWVECDGSVVSDSASVYDGVTLPDLNGGEFLRGYEKYVIEGQYFTVNKNILKRLLFSVETDISDVVKIDITAIVDVAGINDLDATIDKLYAAERLGFLSHRHT